MNEPIIGTIIKMLLISLALGLVDLTIYLTAPTWQHLYEVTVLAAITIWGVTRSVDLLRKRRSR